MGVTTMSGKDSRVPNSVSTDVTLFEFDNFTIHPATFWIDQMDGMEIGYGVVYKADGITQIYSPSIMGAIQHAVGAEQTLQYYEAMQEAKTLEGSTEGLLGDALAGPNDTVN